MAQGDTDAALARSCNTEIRVFYGAVNQIARTLRVEGTDYDSKRQQVVKLAQRFFKIAERVAQPESSPFAGPELATEEVDNKKLGDEVYKTHNAPITQQSLPKVQTLSSSESNDALPPLTEVVERLKRLPELKRRRLESVAGSKKGDGTFNRVAQELSLQPTSLVTIISKIYQELGLPNIKGRKRLLVNAFAVLKGELARLQIEQAHNPPAAVLSSVVKMAEVSEERQPSDAVSERKAFVAEEVPAGQRPAVSQKPNGFGAGVVIPIPPDAVNIDVVSGEFRNQQPSHDLKNEIAERRRKGLNPAFVVLYLSGEDPSIARGHLVFLEREKR